MPRKNTHRSADAPIRGKIVDKASVALRKDPAKAQETRDFLELLSRLKPNQVLRLTVPPGYSLRAYTQTIRSRLQRRMRNRNIAVSVGQTVDGYVAVWRTANLRDNNGKRGK